MKKRTDVIYFTGAFILLNFLFIDIVHAQTNAHTTWHNDLQTALQTPDSVFELILSCDKTDSLGRNLLIFKNLKTLSIFTCSYQDAYQRNLLTPRQRRLVETKNAEVHRKNSKRYPSTHARNRYIYDWDKVFFSNRIRYISLNLDEMKHLTTLEIMGRLSRRARKTLDLYSYRRNGFHIYINGKRLSDGKLYDYDKYQ